MPELKRQYERWRAAGLEVLGVSFDDDAEVAEATYARLEIPWELVVIPSDEDERRLWTEATRITTLPTILLIDQEGVLHALLEGQEIDDKLDQQVQQLLMPSASGRER